MMTNINHMISQIPSKFEISLAESVALFGCGFITYGILSNLFKKINNIQLERQLRREQALRKEDEERFEQEMETEAQCFRIIRGNDIRKIGILESQRNEMIVAYRALEQQNRELISQLNTVEADDSPEERDYVSEISEQTFTEEDDEDFAEIAESVRNAPVTRRLWTNEEKRNGTYQHQLPDGFNALYKSVKCKKTMHLTFRKAEEKEGDRWIIDETGNEYKNLNQARNAFFGDELKMKQSVWLHTRSTKDGRSLREVIEA